MSGKPWESELDGDLDPQVELWFRDLDPGRTDPAYWVRFHHATLARSRRELARRRRVPDPTVSGTLFSWSRAVVPVALMAAVLAGLLLVQPRADRVPLPALVEDVLATGLGPSIPVFLESEETLTGFLAVEAY